MKTETKEKLDYLKSSLCILNRFGSIFNPLRLRQPTSNGFCAEARSYQSLLAIVERMDRRGSCLLAQLRSSGGNVLLGSGKIILYKKEVKNYSMHLSAFS